MNKMICVLAIYVLSATTSQAKEWLAYSGGGISYDAFLRDKEIMRAKANWPFQLGVNIVAGASYRTDMGFNIFADCNLGITRIQIPAPDTKKSNNFYEQAQTRLMIGSGPKLPVGYKGNHITPFIQLGASYFTNFGTSGIGKDDQDVWVSLNQDISRDSWRAVVGGGMEWYFEARTPSSINLQVAYTPLPIFSEPVAYTAHTPKGTYDLQMQGKLVQMVLTFKVYFRLSKRE